MKGVKSYLINLVTKKTRGSEKFTNRNIAVFYRSVSDLVPNQWSVRMGIV